MILLRPFYLRQLSNVYLVQHSNKEVLSYRKGSTTVHCNIITRTGVVPVEYSSHVIYLHTATKTQRAFKNHDYFFYFSWLPSSRNVGAVAHACIHRSLILRWKHAYLHEKSSKVIYLYIKMKLIEHRMMYLRVNLITKKFYDSFFQFSCLPSSWNVAAVARKWYP